MGQLADDVAHMFIRGDYRGASADRSGSAQRRESLVARIAELEARVAQFESPIVIPDDGLSVTWQANADRDYKPENVEVRSVMARRLADAEQRAAAAWTAVTNVVVRHMRVMDVVEVQPDADGNAFMTGLGTYSQIGGVNKRILLAVLLPSSPANPDLLERASVELAEAYQRAKAEEQRQAEQAADAKENAVFRATPKDPDADAVTFTMRMTP